MTAIQRFLLRFIPVPPVAPVWVNEVRIPAPGETWVFYPDRDAPWPKEEGHKCTILDVRANWVKYKVYTSESRMRIGSFIDMYAPTS